MPTISQGRVTAGTGNVVFVPATSGGSTLTTLPSGATSNAPSGSSGSSGSTGATGPTGPQGPTGPAGGGGAIIAPSFSNTGTWEPSQQIVAIQQFNMVFDGVQIIGSNGSYLKTFVYTEGISD